MYKLLRVLKAIDIRIIPLEWIVGILLGERIEIRISSILAGILGASYLILILYLTVIVGYFLNAI